MCQACGMNHFDEDDIDYDDAAVLASLGIDDSSMSDQQAQQQPKLTAANVFVAIDKNNTDHNSATYMG